MSTRAAVLAGLGGYLPPRTVTNEELSRRLDTSDEWIRKRTGIERRHVADQGVSTGDLAVEAGHRALKSAGGSDAVDMVIVATATPDQPVPATAPDVAARLGLGPAAAFDLQAGCSGFLYGLATASAALIAGHAERVLLIGAEVFSTVLNAADRTTAVIFGDGAAAVLLRAGTADEPGAVLAIDLGADGTGKDLITIPGGGARQRSTGQRPDPDAGYIHMRGKETFAHAVQRMEQSSRVVLGKVGWSADQVDHVVGHQANLRILHTLALQLGVGKQRVISHIQEAGNTSSASIPLALADAGARGRLHTGQRMLLTAFGAGLTWGSAVLTWPGLTPG
ncbi:beta-ketoacyl-ACP synthase III [Streptomyces pseudovenezuelae]|uniref:beta-ketoacyl-ACP synthase III n=1 Tax=Streptomyces pseudovenezuelae TaxID=67350 RepID=UPI0034A4A38B